MIWWNEVKMRTKWDEGKKGEYDNGMRPVAPLTKLFNLVITSNIMCGMKLLIQSYTSTVQPLKFRNG